MSAARPHTPEVQAALASLVFAPTTKNPPTTDTQYVKAPRQRLQPLDPSDRRSQEFMNERRVAFERRHSKVRRNWVLPEGFPSRAVTDAYLKPSVDSSEAPLSWARPNLHGLREFCADKFGWTQVRPSKASKQAPTPAASPHHLSPHLTSPYTSPRHLTSHLIPERAGAVRRVAASDDVRDR